MLYMVGKIFLFGVRFDIVYNDSFSENVKMFGKPFFLHKSQKIYRRIKTKGEVSEKCSVSLSTDIFTT